MRAPLPVMGCVLLACQSRVAYEEEEPGFETWPAPTEPAPEPDGPSPEPEAPSKLCFEQRVVLTGEPGLHALTVADTTGDGLPELWLHSGNSVVGLSRSGAQYEPIGGFAIDFAFFFGWADLDGSGREDAVYFALEPFGGHARLSDPTGLPLVEFPLALPFEDWHEELAFFDVTGNGRADLIARHPTLDLLQLWEGDGAGGFTPFSNAELPAASVVTQIHPSRAVGRSFAATVASTDALVTLVGLAPGGALARHATSEPLQDPFVLDMRPVLGERPDAVVQHIQDGRTVVDLLAAQDDRLMIAWQSPEIDASVAGDFDGDGRVDVLWTHEGRSYAVARPPTGEPVAVDFTLSSATSLHPPVVADLDGDGRDEIVQLRTDADSYTIELIETVACP